MPAPCQVCGTRLAYILPHRMDGMGANQQGRGPCIPRLSLVEDVRHAIS